MRKIAAGIVLLAVLVGCWGGGGDNPPPLSTDEIVAIVMAVVQSQAGGADVSGSWHSPTAEPGNEQIHTATIALVPVLLAALPPQQNAAVRAWCATDAGAMFLLKVVNSAACPVSKGLLIVGGWSLVQDVPPTEGFIGAVYHVEKGGVVIH